MNPIEQSRQAEFQETLLSAHHTMVLSEILKLAMDSFRASKMRFALTALGMVIGTASVILVVTIGLTGKRYILEQIQKVETNSVELEYFGGGATDAERVLYNDFLTHDDEKAVDAQVPSVLYSSPILTMHDRISFGGGVVKDTLVLGVSPQYQNIRNLLVPVGRFFDENDDAGPHQMRRGHRTFCPRTLRQLRRGRRPDLRDQRHSLHHHRRLQGERGRLWRIGDPGPDHPDSLFRGALLHGNRRCESDLLFHAQHGRGSRCRKRDRPHRSSTPPARLGI